MKHYINVIIHHRPWIRAFFNDYIYIYIFLYRFWAKSTWPWQLISICQVWNRRAQVRHSTQLLVRPHKTFGSAPRSIIALCACFLSLVFSLSHSCLSSGPIASQVDWWRVPCPWQHLPIKLFSLVRQGLRRWVWEAVHTGFWMEKHSETSWTFCETLKNLLFSPLLKGNKNITIIFHYWFHI